MNIRTLRNGHIEVTTGEDEDSSLDRILDALAEREADKAEVQQRLMKLTDSSDPEDYMVARCRFQQAVREGNRWLRIKQDCGSEILRENSGRVRSRTSRELGRKPDIQTRGRGSKVVGWASVFYEPGVSGTEYRLGRKLVERIGRNAFDRALSEKHDVRAMFNHNPDHILARTAAGTLRLHVDRIGLRYEADLPRSSIGQQVAEALATGNVNGSSFGFSPLKQIFSRENDIDVLTVADLILYDVSPVTFPAYKAASSSLRAAG